MLHVQMIKYMCTNPVLGRDQSTKVHGSTSCKMRFCSDPKQQTDDKDLNVEKVSVFIYQ